MTDLWPDTIGSTKLRAPVTILREQASLLGRKTRNLVQAEVAVDSRSSLKKYAGYFFYHFFIVAPSLSGYRYKLFSIQHQIDLYPVGILVEEKIWEEVHPRFKVHLREDEDENSYLVAESEEEFIDILRAVFSSEKSLQVIRALKSQSETT